MGSPGCTAEHDAHGFATLVRALAQLDDLRREHARVAHLVEQAALAPDVIDRHLWFRARGYTRTLVHREARFEVLLLCWAAGACSPVHDHAGQECWFRPLLGAFDTEDYALVDQAGEYAQLALCGRRRRLRTLDPGRGPELIHRVRVSDGLACAVSLHVYAKPIAACRVFDLDERRATVRPLRCDRVLGTRR
jgi:cysteine dioxygenase